MNRDQIRKMIEVYLKDENYNEAKYWQKALEIMEKYDTDVLLSFEE